MTRARNIAGFSTITTTPSPVHVGPIGVLTATRIDGEFNLVDLDTRDITAQGIGVTNLQVSGITTGLNVSGIITAQNGINFNGTSTGFNASGVTTVADLSATTVSIAGTLTYEDVTNVDSVGVITARGLDIFGNTTGLNVTSGISTFTGDISLNSTDKKIYLSSDSDQYITANAASNYIAVATGNVEKLRVDSSGRLLVGTTSANSNNKIHARLADGSIASNSSASVILAENSGNSWITIGSGASSYGGILFADSGSADIGQVRYNHNGNVLEFHTNSAERMRIREWGDVNISNKLNVAGIVTTTALTVSGATTPVTINHTGGNALHLTRSSKTLGFNANYGASNTHATIDVTSGMDLRFSVGGADKITVDSTGSLGINETAPTDPLHIKNTASDKGILIKTTGNTYHTICGDANRSSANDNILRIDSKWNGTVVTRIRMLAGADTTNKDDGIFCFDTASGGAMGERLRITTGGQLFVGGNTGYNESSSLLSIATDDSAGANMLSDSSAIYNHNNPAFIHIQNRYNTGSEQESGIILHSKSSYNASWAIYNKRTANYVGDLIFRNRTGSSASGERLRLRGNDGRVIINNDLEFNTDGSGGLFGKFAITNQAYTANANLDIALTTGNYIFSVRSGGVYHYNAIFVVTYFDSADKNSVELIHGDYGTTATHTVIHNGSNNGTFRLTFNRNFDGINVRQLKLS